MATKVKTGGAWGRVVRHREAELLDRIAALEAELRQATRVVNVSREGEERQRTVLETVHARLVRAQDINARLVSRLAAESAACRAACRAT